MPNQLKLVIEFDDFRNEIDEFLSFARDLFSEDIRDEGELKRSILAYLDWEQKVAEFLGKSFNYPTNRYYKEFADAKIIFYRIPLKEVDQFSLDLQEYKARLQNKISILETISHLIEVADAVNGQVSGSEGYFYTTEPELNVLLEKLYLLPSGRYFDIKAVLEGNNIFKTFSELRDLLKKLPQKNILSTMVEGTCLLAKLTDHGRKFIELQRHPKIIDYNYITKTPQELHQAIVVVTQYLDSRKSDFDFVKEEIFELEQLYTHLNRRAWGQLVKAKLLDMLVSRFIDIKTVSYIYNSLTGGYYNIEQLQSVFDRN